MGYYLLEEVLDCRWADSMLFLVRQKLALHRDTYFKVFPKSGAMFENFLIL